MAPENGARILRDPDAPAAAATLGLAAWIDPPASQVMWIVDGVPFSLTDYPHVVRWPLAPGEHTFQARLPYSRTASRRVRVTVQ